MTTDIFNTRLQKLEILFSEQEYTIETLNTIVTNQHKDIQQLTAQIELIKHQLNEQKKQHPDTSIIDEKPPHY